MGRDGHEEGAKGGGFEDPAILRVALTDTRFAWL